MNRNKRDRYMLSQQGGGLCSCAICSVYRALICYEMSEQSIKVKPYLWVNEWV